MKIATISKNKQTYDLLAAVLKEYSAINQLKITPVEFESGEAFLEGFRAYSYALVFIDIDADPKNIFEFADKSRSVDPDLGIVFISSNADHMADAFKVHAFDYIVIPFEASRILNLLNEYFRTISISFDSPMLSFTSNRVSYSLPFESIKYVKTSSANYLEIIDNKGHSYRTRMTFSQASAILLADNRFLSVLRGIIVNMDYVNDIERGLCHIEKNINVPINIKNSGELRDIWENYKYCGERASHKKGKWFRKKSLKN